MYLILGATGFIGRALLAALEAGGAPYVGLGRQTEIVSRGSGSPQLSSLSAGRRANIIRELPALDAVIFVAGPALANLSSEELRAAHLGSLEQALDALATTQRNVPFVYASSALVYGRRSSRQPLREIAEPKPDSAYGEVKLACEILLSERREGLRSRVARLFNVTGAGHTKGIVSEIACQAAAVLDGRVAHFHLRSNSSVIDLIDVRDAAAALIALADAPVPPPVANVCSGRATTSDDLIDAARAVIGREVPIVYDQRTTEETALIGSPRLMEAATGWRARRKVPDIVRDAIAAAMRAEGAA
jgi:nucleoside-diphosphate-sugar epimerase